MSRIKEKLSRIFAKQIPEFLRVSEAEAATFTTGSTVAGSDIVTVNTSIDIEAGDKLSHSQISGAIYVISILSNTKIQISASAPVTLTSAKLNFVRTNTNSNFIKFLEAYYKFLEQDQYPQELLQNARQYADSETTIDSLIENFFINYGNDIPRNIITDKRSFIKHFRDIHKTKGTEEAYKLLFRIIFNDQASFFYPDTVILKASDGVWKKDYTLRVISIDNSNIFNFINTKIVGDISKASAVVNNVVKFKPADGFITDVYELSLEKIKGNFLIENITATKLIDAVTNTKEIINAEIIPQLIKVDIIDGENGYNANTKISVLDANVKISGFTNTGGIRKISIVNSAAYLNLKPIINNGVILSGLNINVSLSDPLNIVSGNITLSNTIGTFTSDVPHGLSRGKTANLIFYGNSNSYINGAENVVTVTTVLDSSRFRFNMIGLSPTSLSANLKYTQAANLYSNVGAVLESDGYWLNNRGKLSELIYVQGPALDSTNKSKIFYQPYSYVVRSGESIDSWKDIAKATVHPAGMEVFGEIDINNQISANVETTVDNEIWDYLGITADMSIPPFDASMTSYSNSRVQNLPISTDHVYYIFNIL
jgi:hypothetical protein